MTLVDSNTGLFHSLEKHSFFKQFLNIICYGFDMKRHKKFYHVNRYFIIPVSLFGFNVLMTLIISPTLNSNVQSLFSLSKNGFVGIDLLLPIAVY